MKKFKNSTAVILAGGKSSRMQEDKALLKYQGRTFIEHSCNLLSQYFSELLISTNRPDNYSFLNLPLVMDEQDSQGPLMGIYSALKQAKNDFCFIIASDIPFINIECIDLLYSFTNNNDIIIPLNGDKPEPLYAFYSKSIIPSIEIIFKTPSRKISDVYSLTRTKFIKTDMHDWYININTKYDYTAFLEKNNTFS